MSCLLTLQTNDALEYFSGKVEVKLTEDHMVQIEKMKQCCIDHGLERASALDSSAVWRFDGEDWTPDKAFLVVTKDGDFFWQSERYPSDYIETTWTQIGEMSIWRS